MTETLEIIGYIIAILIVLIVVGLLSITYYGAIVYVVLKIVCSVLNLDVCA